MAYIEDDPTDGSPARYGTQPQPKATSDPTELFGVQPPSEPTPGRFTTQPVPVPGSPNGGVIAGPTPLFGGGLTPTTSYVNNTKQRTYKGADGNTYADDPNPNSVSGFVRVPQMSAQDFIKQYQGQNAQPDVNGLLEAMKAAGYNVAPYMYGQTPSGNEISLDGQKYKVRVDGGGWWEPSMGEGGGGNGAGGGTGFADPAYNQLAQLAQDRLRALGQPFSFPGLDQYMSELQKDKVLAQQRAQDFASQLSGRVSQLQQPLLSQGDVATQRALASNSLLASRDAALKNQRERRFASGFEPTSGLLAGDERAVNEQYNNRQGQIDAQLQSQMINTDEHRRNEATQLQGLIAQALRGGDISSLQDQATSADMENQLFNIDQNRQREMLTTGNVPVDLTNMGFANASNAANSGGSGLSGIMQLLQLANSQQGIQNQNSQSNMNTLAFILQTLLK